MGTLEELNIFYAYIPARSIFGMVGRCGGGYNTLWEDWTEEGIIARQLITEEYEYELNKICGHYARLEESILESGFKTPLIITCGKPRYRDIKYIPPYFADIPENEWFLLEGVTGGSRLWIAQKHNLEVPCIINDFTDSYTSTELIYCVEHAYEYFKEGSKNLLLSRDRGLYESYDNNKTGYHMESVWPEREVAKLRIPMWFRIMEKHGYTLSNLGRYADDILDKAGVSQTLKGGDHGYTRSARPRSRIR